MVAVFGRRLRREAAGLDEMGFCNSSVFQKEARRAGDLPILALKKLELARRWHAASSSSTDEVRRHHRCGNTTVLATIEQIRGMA
jgi:hypothetical protein